MQLFVCMLYVIIIKYSKIPLLSTKVSAVGILHHTQMEYITFKAKFTTFTETHGLLSNVTNILYMKED
jgi:hypothetical protein